MLAFSRAFGETLAIVMVIGNTVQIPRSLFDAAYPLPALIANAYSEMMSIPLYQSAQAALALAVLVAAVAGMNYFVWAGLAAAGPVHRWSAVTVVVMVGFFGLIRSGWSRRFRDPTLTVAQMVFALASGAVAYALLGAGRGAVFPAMMGVLMLGMFVASPRQMRWVSVYAVALDGLAQPAAVPGGGGVRALLAGGHHDAGGFAAGRAPFAHASSCTAAARRTGPGAFAAAV